MGVQVVAAVTVTSDGTATFHLWLPEADPARKAEGYDGTPVGPANMTAAEGAEWAAELAEVIRLTNGDGHPLHEDVHVSTGWTAPGHETVRLSREQAQSAVDAARWAVAVLTREYNIRSEGASAATVTVA